VVGRGSLVIVGLAIIAGLTGCSFLGGDQGPPIERWEPALSPDGTTLAYETSVDDSLELFLLDLATRTEKQITANKAEDWSPVWSPEGDRLAFASVRDENVDIYVISIDSLEEHRVTTSDADDVNPSWGVDGRIYFNSNRTDSWEVYAIGPDGTNLTKITRPESGE
jgi:Tol biopolymer transport system component